MKVIVPDIPWGETLQEYARPLQACLDVVAPNAPGEVWLGAHHPDVDPPADAIIYQTEVVGSSWFTPAYTAKLARARAVWDYSLCHFKKYPSQAWSHVPLRYHPCLETIELKPVEIPIGFLGSLNGRRRAVLDGAEIMPRLFGADRDAWLARVGVVVVPHFYPGCPVEQNRIGHLLANGIPVVAENAPDEYEYPGPKYAPAGELVGIAKVWAKSSYAFGRGLGAMGRQNYMAAGSAVREVRRALYSLRG